MRQQRPSRAPPRRPRAPAASKRSAKQARSASPLFKRGFQGLVALLGLLIAVTQLVDWLERRGAPPTSPALLKAEFAAIEVRRNELFRDFLREAKRGPKPDETDQFGQRGVGMRMPIRTQANPERTFVVRWTVYNRATGRPVPGARWSRIATRLRARRDARVRTVPCWVPLPDKPGRYYVRLTVETEEGRVLAVTRTPVLRRTTRN